METAGVLKTGNRYGACTLRNEVFCMKVAVVGSGVMGLGITQAFAQSEGYEVNLCVVSGKGFDHKRALLEKPLKRQVAKEKITQERMDEIMGKITLCDINGCKEADLIVESAIENLQAKEKLLKEIEEIAKPVAADCINTSSLSITEISAS